MTARTLVPVHGRTLLLRVALVQVNDGQKRASDCRRARAAQESAGILRPMHERSKRVCPNQLGCELRLPPRPEN